MAYLHQFFDKNLLKLPVGKVICVGRNYAAHAKELNHCVPSEPILFLKPTNALIAFDEPIQASSFEHALHYELEIAVLLNSELKNANKETAIAAIAGIGLSLDLTFRDLQDKLKQKGHPWEKSKAFDNSCPTSRFVKYLDLDLEDLSLVLKINNEIRQSGNSADMLVDIASLLAYSSKYFTLNPGDIVITGTPAGVGVLKPGDKLEAHLSNILSVNTTVI